MNSITKKFSQNTTMNLRINTLLFDKFKEICKQNNANASEVIREMVKDFVQKEGKIDVFKYWFKKD